MPKNRYEPAKTLAELVREQGYSNQMGFNNEELYWDGNDAPACPRDEANGVVHDVKLGSPYAGPGRNNEPGKRRGGGDPAPGNPYA